MSVLDLILEDLNPFTFAFTPGAGRAAGNSYVLAWFGSTDFTVDDFSYTGLPSGLAGISNLTSNTIVFDVFGPPSTVFREQTSATIRCR
jgi:hypothetical protein